ncbi:MAG: hypothetical protein RIR26_1645 [Pseudomonadota bacterium]|jgi:glucosamine--fructose-6-phosphate aminotransferase (isomerizing)
MGQSYMQTEVVEQPSLIRRRSAQWQQRADEVRSKLLSKKQLVLVGRGSSGNAALFLTYLWGTQMGRQPLDFRLWLAHEGNTTGDYSDCAVVAFSASGQSTDVVRSCSWLKQRGAYILGVTAAADASCRLGEVADDLFLLSCGLEKAVPATKSFMSQLAAAAAICGFPLHEKANLIATSIEKTFVSANASALADFIDGARTVIMLGRGLILGSVHDAALKLQETTGLASFAYSTAEFFHGPLGCVAPDDRVVLFLSDDSELELRLLKSLKERGVPVRVVVRSAVPTEKRANSELFNFLSAEEKETHIAVCELPSTGEAWSDAFAVTALAQMTCLALCQKMGRSPDAPPSLKKVTET